MAEIGSTIPRNNPRYQILKKIGQGGMSEVYLANDLQMDMMVAVKEVRTDIEYDKNGNKVDLNAYIKGLENECDLLKSVDHPVLPRTLSIDRGQKIYVIMDYIDGEDMSKVLKRNGSLSQEQVLDCALQICDALRYLQAHNPPIVYRDLKPSNKNSEAHCSSSCAHSVCRNTCRLDIYERSGRYWHIRPFTSSDAEYKILVGEAQPASVFYLIFLFGAKLSSVNKRMVERSHIRYIKLSCMLGYQCVATADSRISVDVYIRAQSVLTDEYFILLYRIYLARTASLECCKNARPG